MAGGDAGTRRSTPSPPGSARSIERHGRARGRRSYSATRTRTPWPARCTRRCSRAPRHPQLLLRQHRRPDAQARLGGPDVRPPAGHPGARPRPHRLPADARRQPAGVQRHPVHRARLPRQGARRCRRAAARLVVVDPRRTRTADARRRAPVHPARHRRVPAARRSCTRCSPRSSSTSARSPRTSTGSTSSASRSRDFTPEAVAAALRRRRPSASARLARELAAAPTRRGLRPDRHVHGRSSARSRSWLVDVVNVLTGNLDRPGGAMFPQAARRRSARAGPRQAASRSAVAQPGPRRARGQRRAAGRHASPTRSRRRATGRSGR